MHAQPRWANSRHCPIFELANWSTTTTSASREISTRDQSRAYKRTRLIKFSYHKLSAKPGKASPPRLAKFGIPVASRRSVLMARGERGCIDRTAEMPRQEHADDRRQGYSHHALQEQCQEAAMERHALPSTAARVGGVPVIHNINSVRGLLMPLKQLLIEGACSPSFRRGSKILSPSSGQALRQLEGAIGAFA